MKPDSTSKKFCDYLNSLLSLSLRAEDEHLGPVAPARSKKAGCKPYTGLCNVQLYDKYLHMLHQLKLQSGTTTPGVDDAR